MSKQPIDITGKRFGRLVALEETEQRRNGSTVWLCQCDCGNVHLASYRTLMRGNTKSCGCLRMEGHAARWLLKRFKTEDEAIRFVKEIYSKEREGDYG